MLGDPQRTGGSSGRNLGRVRRSIVTRTSPHHPCETGYATFRDAEVPQV